MNNLQKTPHILILACFFLSGAAGLSYEVLWTRILGLSFGHTTYAVTTVVAVFMAGLALGSLLFGRLADRVKNPLRLYGFLELGIGLYCLAAPTLLALARTGYLGFYPSFADRPFLRVIIQFLLAAAVLIVPTSLMGGTLPAVTRALTVDPEKIGRRLAILYGTNTLGAAAGALAAGYWLLPFVGIRWTNVLGAAANILVGLSIIAIAKQHPEPSAAAQARGISRGVPSDGLDRLGKTVLASFALSGAVAMSYQIAWTRALVLVIGNSTYAFSAILVTILTGIAIGSYLFPRFKKSSTPRFFAFLQAGIGVMGFLLIPLFGILPGAFVFLFSTLRGTYSHVLLIQFLLCFLVVLLPACLMGMTLPCVASILVHRQSRIGADVGRYYAFNTWGAVGGSLLTGFFLIPFMGAQGTLSLCISLNFLMAALILILSNPVRKWGYLAAALGACLLTLVFPQWDRLLMVSGASLYPDIYYSQEESGIAVPAHKQWELLFFEEGVDSTVAVTRSLDGVTSLRVNGKSEAGTNPSDIESFIKLAYIPLILHPAPERVALVGLGGGITAYTASRFGTAREINVIELDSAVVAAYEVFSPGDLNVLSDSRVRLVIDDGRSFMDGYPGPFDVIIVGPSNPWIAGVSNLFTQDFFNAARARLAPGGIICQWMQGYNIADSDLKMVMRSFVGAFPGATLWEGSETDYILIGRVPGGPETMDLQDLIARLDQNPGLVRFFEEQGDRPIEALLTSFRLDSADLVRFADSGPVNTDDRNLLEFNAPKYLYMGYPRNLVEEVRAQRRSHYPGYISDPFLAEDESHLRLGKYLLQNGKPEDAKAEFLLIPSNLLPGPVPDSRESLLVSLDGPEGLRETFDGKDRVLPLYPLVAGIKPDVFETGEEVFWNAFYEYFLRVSGIFQGAGSDGSAGLVINSLPEPMPLAFLAPLPVQPETTYQVEFLMRSDVGRNTRSGCGYMEYSSYLPYDDGFTLSADKQYNVGGEQSVSLSGPSPWSRHSFQIHTSPNTRMLHLMFYRLGGDEPGSVFFDDISIRRVMTENVAPGSKVPR